MFGEVGGVGFRAFVCFDEAWDRGPAGLAGGKQDIGPEFAGEFHPFLFADGGADGDVDEDVVPESDEYIGVAGHGGMDGRAGHLVAQEAVGGVGRHAADEIAGINVLERDRQVLAFEVVGDLVAQKDTNVLVLFVARGVARAVLVLKEMLAGAFGNGDDGMLAFEDAVFEGGQEAVGSVEREIDFGHQAEVDFLAGEGGTSSDEAGVAAHEFHQADAVGGAFGFDMGTAHSLLRDLECGGEAERAINVFDVVVDGFWNADYGDLESTAGNFFADGVGTALRAVAADAEQDVDALAVEEIDDCRGVLRAARAGERSAAELVDFGNVGVGDGDRREAGSGVETEISIADAQYVADAVVMGELEVDGADDIVEAGAETAAGDDGGGGVEGIEVNAFAWARLFE